MREAPPPLRRRPHRGAVRLARMVAAVIVVTLVGEGALRVLFHGGLQGELETRDQFPWIAFDPLLAWRNSPGYRQEEFSIGEHGERLVDPGTAAGPQAPRVLFLGDSRTFGVWKDERGLRYDNDFVSRLARLAPARVEVLNAGTIGYTSSQGLRQWMLLDGATRPTVVVVAYGVNDNLYAWNPSYRVSEPRSVLARRLLYRFGGWRSIQLGFWVARRSPFSPTETDWKPWVTLDDYRRNLERFASESRRRDVRLLFLHLPLRPLARGENEPTDEGEATPLSMFGVETLEELHGMHDRFRDATRAVARAQGVPLLDASDGFEAFRALHPDVELYSAYDLVHPNDRGADVIARLVEQQLVALGWMAPAG